MLWEVSRIRTMLANILTENHFCMTLEVNPLNIHITGIQIFTEASPTALTLTAFWIFTDI